MTASRTVISGLSVILVLQLCACGPGIDSPFPEYKDAGNPDLDLADSSPVDATPDSPRSDAPQPKPDGPVPDKLDPSKCKEHSATNGMHISEGRAHNCGGMTSLCIPGEVIEIKNGLCACANGSNQNMGPAANPAKVPIHWYTNVTPLYYYYGPCPS
jgi:hypothetical protein